MKNITFFVCGVLLLLSACKPAIVGFTGGLTDAEYKDKGEKLVKAWNADINKVAKKQVNSAKALKYFGYISLGVGTIGTAVAAGLEEGDASSLSYGIAITTATIGIVQLFISTNPKAEVYKKDSLAVIEKYEASQDAENVRYQNLLSGFNKVRTDTGMGNFDVN